MYVSAHAEQRIRRRLNGTADAVMARLEGMTGTAGSVAIEVHRYPDPVLDGETGSNGDSVVVIAREGTVETVMLRRSWNQPFTRSALRVDRVVRLMP